MVSSRLHSVRCIQEDFPSFSSYLRPSLGTPIQLKAFFSGTFLLWLFAIAPGVTRYCLLSDNCFCVN